MRTVISGLAAVLALSAGTIASLQQPPDFGGTWVATKDAPPVVGLAPSGVFGERFALAINGKALTVIRPVRGRANGITNEFPLDGSESRVMSQTQPCRAPSGQVITTAIDGDVLRYSIVGTLSPGSSTPNKVNVNYTFRKLTADTLVVEGLMRDAQTGQPRPVGTVYRRSAENIPADPVVVPPAPVAPATIAQVAWISGDWIGGTAPSVIEERWSTTEGGTMLGTSRTVRNGALSEFEFLCIFERNGTLVYTAMPNAGEKTDFTLTKIDADSATFENPEHNFPKVIRYAKRADGSMEAVISGAAGSKPITFAFKRK